MQVYSRIAAKQSGEVYWPLSDHPNYHKTNDIYEILYICIFCLIYLKKDRWEATILLNWLIRHVATIQVY